MKTETWNNLSIFNSALLMSALGSTVLVGTTLANPTGGSVAAGSATISNPDALNTNINQSSNKAVINWSAFNIAPNETTTFNQPSVNAATLNRIGDANPSQILGTLNANGQLMLVNRNGMFFGKQANVNVGGLVATTNDISNNNFMNGSGNLNSGGYTFNTSGGNPNAQIVNNGTITTAEGGYAVLSAPIAQNKGTINSPNGRVGIGGGKVSYVNLSGDNLITMAVPNGSAENAQADNSGEINARTVQMLAYGSSNSGNSGNGGNSGGSGGSWGNHGTNLDTMLNATDTSALNATADTDPVATQSGNSDANTFGSFGGNQHGGEGHGNHGNGGNLVGIVNMDGTINATGTGNNGTVSAFNNNNNNNGNASDSGKIFIEGDNVDIAGTLTTGRSPIENANGTTVVNTASTDTSAEAANTTVSSFGFGGGNHGGNNNGGGHHHNDDGYNSDGTADTISDINGGDIYVRARNNLSFSGEASANDGETQSNDLTATAEGFAVPANFNGGGNNGGNNNSEGGDITLIGEKNITLGGLASAEDGTVKFYGGDTFNQNDAEAYSIGYALDNSEQVKVGARHTINVNTGLEDGGGTQQTAVVANAATGTNSATNSGSGEAMTMTAEGFAVPNPNFGGGNNNGGGNGSGNNGGNNGGGNGNNSGSGLYYEDRNHNDHLTINLRDEIGAGEHDLNGDGTRVNVYQGASVQDGVDVADEGGANVNVKPGTFNEDVTVDKNNLNLNGSGWNRTTLNGNVDVTGDEDTVSGFTINGNSSQEAGLMNVSFNGGGHGGGNSGGNGGDPVVHVTGNGATIKNNVIDANDGTGVMVEDSAMSTVRNNVIHDADTGIAVDDSYKPTISNNTIHADNGITIKDTYGAKVTGNHLNGYGWNGGNNTLASAETVASVQSFGNPQGGGSHHGNQGSGNHHGGQSGGNNNGNSNQGETGISLDNSDNAEVGNNLISWYETGIEADDSNNANLHHNSVTHYDTGIDADDSNNLRVNANYLVGQNGGSDGVMLRDSHGGRVTNNRVYNSNPRLRLINSNLVQKYGNNF